MFFSSQQIGISLINREIDHKPNLLLPVAQVTHPYASSNDKNKAPRKYSLELWLIIELPVPTSSILLNLILLACSCHIYIWTKKEKVKLDKVFLRKWQSERPEAAILKTYREKGRDEKD